MILFSGMKPDGTGMGRLMSCLVDQAESRDNSDVEVVCHPTATRSFWYQMLRLRFRKAKEVARQERNWWSHIDDPKVQQADTAVLIQPQTLGFRWCEKFIRERKKPTWMFLVDSSFFCVRSYNHIPGETSACTRCLGGDWKMAKRMKCKPQPVTDTYALKFNKLWQQWVADGTVRCLVQNETQAQLIRAHCGPNAVVKVIGLWTVDFDGLVERSPEPPAERTPYDVVFHAPGVPAKGGRWTFDLARQCPHLKFLFPCSKRHETILGAKAPDNVYFVPMRWESGLADMVAKAPLTLVPSLWSATIEGALVKSIMTARAVATVDEPTAFSSELPGDLIMRLSSDVAIAGKSISDAIEKRWEPPHQVWQTWAIKFRRDNKNLLDRIVSSCDESRHLKSVA